VKYHHGSRDRHNPYEAEVVEFDEVTHYDLRMKFSGSPKDTLDMKKLQKDYSEGLFRRIPWSEKETLLRMGDGSTIGMNSLRSGELMKGYRIPAQKVKANKQLGKLQDLIQPPSDVPTSKSNKRGVSNVSFYTTWSAYRLGAEPAFSSDFEKHRDQGERVVKMTRSLWQEVSRYMRVLCPGQYNELARPELPQGTERLAGVWAGFGVNAGSEAVPVRTKPHRDYKSVFFGKSCLYPFGDFEGGDVILWELRAVLELKAGDVFLFEDHLLTHSNEEVTGERHSLVAFTHQSVLDWHNKRCERQDRKKKKLLKRRAAYQAEKARREKEQARRKRKKEKERRRLRRAEAVKVEGEEE
jgi:hypothetical protein